MLKKKTHIIVMMIMPILMITDPESHSYPDPINYERVEPDPNIQIQILPYYEVRNVKKV